MTRSTSRMTAVALVALVACGGGGSSHDVAQPGPGSGSGSGSSSGGGLASGSGGGLGVGSGNSGGGQDEMDGSAPGDATVPDASPPRPFDGQGTPWTAPVPRVTCGESDVPETGVQGLGTNVRCNVDIVGNVAVPRFLSMAWWNNCAYVNDSMNNATHVIDVSNDASPVVGKSLTTTGMQNNWESMKVGPTGLLAGYAANGSVLDVYDVTADCKNPALKSSFNVGGLGHAGDFSPDGKTYYASSLYTSTVYAVNLTDPTNPTTTTSTFGSIGTHDLNTGKGGDRAYFTYLHLTNFSGGSVGIVDTSQIQARASGATGTLVKEYDWADGSTTQYPIPVTYRGKDYLIVTDELGSGNCNDPTKPPYGYARIIDISDEMNPSLVSLIKTEAEDPANCQAATQQAGTAFPAFGVGTHYCNVDRPNDPRILACGLWAGGLRVYDISNPWRPKDLAYMQTGTSGSVSSMVRIIPETKKLWVQTDSTFYVLSLRGSVVDPIFASTP